MQPEYPSQQPPPQYPYAPPQPKSGMPIWGWILIGCAGAGLLMVVVLAAILFPVFAQAREKARQTSCLSNIKQTNLGMMMYVQDYDETFPHTTAWKDVTFVYTKSEGLYHCPSVFQRGVGGSQESISEGTPYGYAFNSDLLGLSMSKIESPRTTLMIYDSSNLGKNATDAGISLPTPGRHLKTNNIGYVDGHASRGNNAFGGAMP